MQISYKEKNWKINKNRCILLVKQPSEGISEDEGLVYESYCDPGPFNSYLFTSFLLGLDIYFCNKSIQRM